MIYIASYLKNLKLGTAIWDELNSELKKEIIPLPSKYYNPWCRDYMPVKGANGDYVLFKYFLYYYAGHKPLIKTLVNTNEICEKVLGIKPVQSEIYLDGGAIEIFDHAGIVSDRIIYDNSPVWSGTQCGLFDTIKEQLGLKKLIVVPADPFDFTGHIDGIVRFIDEKTVLVNDYTRLEEKMASDKRKYGFSLEVYLNWKRNFMDTLSKAGLRIETIVCQAGTNSDSDYDATGIYLNFLKLADKIVMPVYKAYPSENKEAEETLKRLYKVDTIIKIEATELAENGGGIINCITWTK
jgi:agmatine deiminase